MSVTTRDLVVNTLVGVQSIEHLRSVDRELAKTLSCYAT